MKTREDVGVVVGRFQVPEFHDGHKYLLNFVSERHKEVLVVLAMSAVHATVEDPLDYGIRCQMIRDMFPQVYAIAPIRDEADDHSWSRELDDTIETIYPYRTARLYGGRDSFIRHYFGRFATKEIESISDLSGTSVRSSITCMPDSIDFRRGMIYALKTQYPRINMTVDIAVTDRTSVLMGKKSTVAGLVFPGGFVSSDDESLECAAARELREETGMVTAGGLSDFRYLGSFTIDDWRFRGRRDKIVTAFFKTRHFSGVPKAGDDLDDVAWLHVDETHMKFVAPHHQPLFRRLLDEYA